MWRARLRGWIRALDQSICAAGLAPRHLGLAAAAGLFLMQNAQVLYYVSVNADSRAIVRAFDDDAGNAIDVASRSRWVTDNGFASYGPVYFRVSSTLATWLAPISEPGTLPKFEARTKAEHFGLTVTSLLALATLALFFASLLTDEAWFTLVLATLFEWAFLRSGTWQYLVLKAHPDHLLGLIVAVATYVSARGWREPESLPLARLSAWAWGVALATKASVILFTPFVGLAFVLTRTHAPVRRSLEYVGHVALAYFVVGFPQNFNLPRLFRFLTYQSGYSKPATAESIAEWFTLWGDQLVAPLVVAVVLVVLARKRTPSTLELSCGVLLAIGPALTLLPQRVLAPHAHYPIPVVTAEITLLLTLLARRATWAPAARLAVTLAALTFFYVAGLVPRGFDALLAKELECRPEAREVFAAVNARVARNERIYVDPYVPTGEKSPNVRVNWRTTPSFIAENDFDALVLNRPYFERYFENERRDYVDVYNHAAGDSAAFYALFRDRPTEIDDARVGHWRRELVRCQWEIWLRVRNGAK